MRPKFCQIKIEKNMHLITASPAALSLAKIFDPSQIELIKIAVRRAHLRHIFEELQDYEWQRQWDCQNTRDQVA
jgi:hypothetical protein